MFVIGRGFHASELAGRENGLKVLNWSWKTWVPVLTPQFHRKSGQSHLNLLSPPPTP